MRVQEVHRDEREQLRRPALQEQHVVRVAEAEQLLAARDRLIDDGVEFLAAVADLGDAEALALVVEQRRGGLFEHLGRQHRGAGTEIENSV